MFGGPWLFSFLLSCILVLLALLLSSLRIKLVGSGCFCRSLNSIEQRSHHHLPHLLSLSEVVICWHVTVQHILSISITRKESEYNFQN